MEEEEEEETNRIRRVETNSLVSLPPNVLGEIKKHTCGLDRIYLNIVLGESPDRDSKKAIKEASRETRSVFFRAMERYLYLSCLDLCCIRESEYEVSIRRKDGYRVACVEERTWCCTIYRETLDEFSFPLLCCFLVRWERHTKTELSMKLRFEYMRLIASVQNEWMDYSRSCTRS